MAGLGKQRAVAKGRRAPPVTPDVAVCEMPPAYRLGVLQGDDVADDAVEEEELAEEDVMRAVPEDVADGEDLGPAGGGGGGGGGNAICTAGARAWRQCFINSQAIPKRQGQRLLTEDMQPQRREGRHNLDVCFVKRADENTVHPSPSPIWPARLLLSPRRLPLQPFPPIAKLLAVGWPPLLAPDILPAEFGALEGVRFGDGMDACGGAGCYGAGVGIAAGAGADDQETEATPF